ncbi:UNVERIFIED_CONTAM: hypothetical protein K2H54_046759 [Gekko kuhli]
MLFWGSLVFQKQKKGAFPGEAGERSLGNRAPLIEESSASSDFLWDPRFMDEDMLKQEKRCVNCYQLR